MISYFNKPKKPKVHITPIQTTKSDINVARKDLKKKKKIIDVTNKAASTKRPISSTIFCAFNVRIYGIPDTRTLMPYVSSNVFIAGIKSFTTKSFLAGVFTMSFFKYIAERMVFTSALLNKKLS